MPEDPVPIAQYNFTLADVGRFLAEKWKLSVCEVCLEKKTYAINTFDRKMPIVVALPLNKSGDKVTTYSEHLHANIELYCNNCGNVKLISANTIDTWLELNK